jgi:hypothetical protein
VIKKGYSSQAKYWGNYRVKDVVKLEKPIECFSQEKGKVLFNPTIVKLEWEVPPSKDKHDIWFPYWITIDNKEKYGQFAPMIGENGLLELMQGAIDHDFFSFEFLVTLKNTLENKIQSSK